jgi:phosphohistidine swiveling domain-containing protein
MTQTKEHAAHFRISGADFTRIARERLLEDAPGHAWRIATCLGNDSGEDRDSGVADIALGILNGTKKLVGDERDMRVVKEHAKVTAKHVKDVDFIYAGRIRIGDKWYRPIAYVSDMGARDMRNDHGKPVMRIGSGMRTGYGNRAWHYCGRDEIVVDNATYKDPHSHGMAREVIFRTCGERPHWMDVPRDGQAALDEFLALGHSLEERSHSKWYGTTSEEIWADDANERTPLEMNDGPEQPARVARGIYTNAERNRRERAALEKGDVGLMNARINAELELANELDEDDRPEIQALRDDPQRGEMIKRAYKKGLGVGVIAEMLDEMDPTALAKLKPETAHEIEAERLREDYRLAQEITDEAAREEAEDQIDAEREALRLRRLADLRVVILKQAGDDLLDLSWNVVMNHDNTEVRVPAGSAKVPRAPFLHWAFARMKMFEEQLPPWQTVCPPGMKMMNDDPYHTDWVVGAGLDPDDRSLLYYPGPVADAAMQLAHELQDKFDKPSPVHVLVDGPHAIGPVHHGKRKKPCPAGAIVVLPNLHPDYVITIEDAVGVITEEGGAVAHLAQVGRERNLPIVRIENALKRFAPDEQIVIDTASRSVTGL